MDKTCDTQLLSPRQVLFLAPEGSALRALVTQSLCPPQYILVHAHDLEPAIAVLGDRKIEVLLFEPEAGRTRSRTAVARLKATDPAVEIVVIAPRLTLVATVTTLQRDDGPALEFDYLGTPVSGPELVRSIERAREVRFLRRSEERRRGVEARMSALVEAVPHAVVSLDENGTIHDWNSGAKKIFGWSAAEAVGQCFWDLALPAGSRGPPAMLPGLNDPSMQLELVGHRRDGTAFPAMMALARVPLPGGAMFCVLVEDVADARRMEVELRLAQKLEAVGRLASGLAHEINTPCQFIGSNGQFLSDAFKELDGLLGTHEHFRQLVLGQSPTPGITAAATELAHAHEAADLEFLRARTPGALDSIAEGVRRIAVLVAAMQDFAQPEVDKAEAIDLNKALQSTLTVVQHQARAVGQIDTAFADLPFITGLPGDLNQAFLGIVLNAIQALDDRQQRTGERGRILVTTRTLDDGGTVEVAITDSGLGIPEAIRGRIFDPFFTTREVGRGSGQGLSVARSIVVDKHRGTLTFETEVGVSTTFYVRLPVAGGGEARAD